MQRFPYLSYDVTCCLCNQECMSSFILCWCHQQRCQIVVLYELKFHILSYQSIVKALSGEVPCSIPCGKGECNFKCNHALTSPEVCYCQVKRTALIK